MTRCSSVLACVASLLGPFVLLFYALSFSTDYWVSYTVDRTQLPKDLRTQSRSEKSLRFYHSRNRGLFRECVQGNETDFVDDNSGSLDINCFNVNYEPEIKTVSDRYSGQYWARLHLLRCHLAFLAIGLVTYTVAFVVGMVICCKRHPGFLKAAGLFAFTSAFSTAAAIAFFHGAEYIERNTITDRSDGEQFYQNWPKELKDASSRRYDWSYILGWTGMILAAICAVCYIIAAWMLKSEQKMEDSDEILKHRYSGGPMLIQDPGYVEDPYYNKMFYQHARPAAAYPYIVEMSNRPAVAYGEHHWQWQ
ncbi:uncharacterized protein LOC135475313 [Liolophura sinensis]|uniref:uncharacterized protein LOC135475313 n=1 Tax=Liolophura sinensis TaxID=3198878 RepID=UPI0031599319